MKKWTLFIALLAAASFAAAAPYVFNTGLEGKPERRVIPWSLWFEHYNDAMFEREPPLSYEVDPARGGDPREALNEALADPSPEIALWTWARSMLDDQAVPVHRVRFSAERTARHASEELERKERLFGLMTDTLTRHDPDNGWTELLLAWADANRGIGRYPVRIADTQQPERKQEAEAATTPKKDEADEDNQGEGDDADEAWSPPADEEPAESGTRADRYVVDDAEAAASAARRLHETVRRPTFTMFEEDAVERWLRARGEPRTVFQALAAIARLSSPQSPQLRLNRQFARRMVGEAERRAPARTPETYLYSAPSPDDPEPPRPALAGGRASSPAQQAEADAWRAWFERQDWNAVNFGAVMPPPLPRPPDAPDDGLTAFDIFHDLQTLGARQVVDEPSLIGVLVGQATIQLGTTEGIRVLAAAGDEAGAARLRDRGRRLLWPRLVASLSRRIENEKTGASRPIPGSLRQYEEMGLLDDPALRAESERWAGLAMAAAEADAEAGEDGEWDSRRAGVLAALVLSANSPSVPAVMTRATSAARENMRRFEFYGGEKLGFLKGMTTVITLGFIGIVAAYALVWVGWGLLRLTRPETCPRPPGSTWEHTPRASPPYFAVLLAVLLFFLFSRALPAVLTEWPGTPSHEYNSSLLLGLAPVGINAPNADTVLKAFATGEPWGDWLTFWYGWGLLAGGWALVALAFRRFAASAETANGADGSAPPTPRAAPADPAVPAAPVVRAGGLRRCLGWGTPGWVVLAVSAVLFIAAYLAGPGTDGVAWLPLPEAVQRYLSAGLLIATAAALAWLALRAVVRRPCRRAPGGLRLAFGGLAGGLLLWVTVGYAWSDYQERRWAARDTVLIPRVDRLSVTTPLGGRVVEWNRLETKARLEKNP